MRIIITLLFITAFISSCNDNQKKSPETQSTSKDTVKKFENKAMIPKSSCYMGILKKDTVRMKVEVFENVVIGTLSYKPYEKDSNTGEFEGQLIGDTLIADYKFVSEGIISVRQIKFLIKNNFAREGHGEMIEKNDRMEFKNINEVVFDDGFDLKIEDCNY